MITKLITKEEAAQILGVRPTTIGRYWRIGRLAFKVVNHKRRCIYDEVVNLLESQNADGAMRVKNEIVRLKYRVTTLENAVELIYKRLEIPPRLVYTDVDLKGLYVTAKEFNTDAMDAGRAMAWAKALNSISEADLSRLKALMSDPFPWAAFINMLDRSIVALQKKRRFGASATLQQAVIELQLSKEHLRTVGRIVFEEESTQILGSGESFVKTLMVPRGPIPTTRPSPRS